MSEEVLERLEEVKKDLLDLQRSPSQWRIFTHLVLRGRPLGMKEIAGDLKMTYKATERAISKLKSKGLIEQDPFGKGYYCDVKRTVLCVLLMLRDLQEARRVQKE